MGNKRNRRSISLETPSPKREVDRTQVETTNAGNMTITNVNSENPRNFGDGNSESQLNEGSLIRMNYKFGPKF